MELCETFTRKIVHEAFQTAVDAAEDMLIRLVAIPTPGDAVHYNPLDHASDEVSKMRKMQMALVDDDFLIEESTPLTPRGRAAGKGAAPSGKNAKGKRAPKKKAFELE